MSCAVWRGSWHGPTAQRRERGLNPWGGWHDPAHLQALASTIHRSVAPASRRGTTTSHGAGDGGPRVRRGQGAGDLLGRLVERAVALLRSRAASRHGRGSATRRAAERPPLGSLHGEPHHVGNRARPAVAVGAWSGRWCWTD